MKERKATQPVLVSWCPDNETFIAPYEKGPCLQCDEPRRRARKRRMYICPLPGCDEPGFFDRAAALRHNHAE